MKLPHITIEYQEEESFAFGKLSAALIIGFGIHFTWMFLAQFSMDGLFITGGERETPFYVHTLSLVVFSLTLLAYAVFLKKARALFNTAEQRNRMRLAAAVVASLGTFAIFGTDISTAQGIIFIIASAVMTGVGSAVLLMSYGVSFSVCDIATIATSTALALLIAPLGFLVITWIAAAVPFVAAVLTALIPLAEFLCLRICSRNLVDKLTFAASTIPIHIGKFALHICIPAFVFGFAICGLRHDTVAWTYTSGFYDTTVHAVPIVIACVVVCVLILLVMLTQRQTINFMFRTLLPVSAVCIAFVVLFDTADSPDGAAVLFGGYILLEGALWMYFADVSQRYRISAFQAFGFGRGALGLGTLLAVLLFQTPVQSIGFDTDPQVSAVVTLACFVVGFAFLPNNAEMLRTLKFGKSCPAFLQEDDASVIGGLIHSDTRITTPAEDAAQVVMTPSDAADATEATAKGADDAAPAAPAEAVAEAAPEAAPVPEKPDATAGDETKFAGRFQRKVQNTADRYLLSKRETEVLFLLAKGRNAASIQESLYISEGTARTHMRRIYAKLDVHSQKELMDLVELESDIRD